MARRVLARGPDPGSFSDPGTLDTHLATVDYGDGAGVQSLPLDGDNRFSLIHTYRDNGLYTVTVTVTDSDGDSGTDTLVMAVQNVAPAVGAITGPPSHPIGIGITVEVAAEFTDPGVLDTHTVEIDWGDGTISSGTVPQGAGAGAGSVTGSHQYTTASTYTITVMDKDGEVGQGHYQSLEVEGPPQEHGPPAEPGPLEGKGPSEGSGRAGQ